MTAAQVATWNAARLPVYANVTANLLTHGKYSWSLLRDANVRGPPNTNGGLMMPTNVSCAAWMRQRCNVSYAGITLVMSPVDLQHMERIVGPTIPEPFQFMWLRQQLAAFLLLRGPHAFFGTGWAMARYQAWQPEYDLDFGVPLQVRAGAPVSLRALFGFSLRD